MKSFVTKCQPVLSGSCLYLPLSDQLKG